MNPLWALLGGLCGAGVVVGLAARRKQAVLLERGVAVEAALAARGQALEGYLLTRGEKLEQEVEALALQTARPLARTIAEQWLSTAYGLTPQRLRQVNQLAAEWT